MRYFIALLLTLPVYAAKIDEGTTVGMKWITIDFEKAPQVTLKGKLKIEKDCNGIFLQNQHLSLISHDKYVLTVDEVTTTMGCPDTKKTTIELDLQPVTLMNNKRNTIQILIPAGATFTFDQKKP